MIRTEPSRAAAGVAVRAASCGTADAVGGELRFPALVIGACWLALSSAGYAQAGVPQAGAAQAGSVQTGSEATRSVAVGQAVTATPDRHKARAAEQAYLAGAKKLEQNRLEDAEREFERALALDPENRTYAMAISVAREHRVSELVRRASSARIAGDDRGAETLIAEARTLDPENPLVTEHSGAFVRQAVGVASGSGRQVAGDGGTAFEGSLQVDHAAASAAGWRIEGPVLASAFEIRPSATIKSFDLRGASSDVIRNVASAYGIRVVIDDSVERKSLRFNLENVGYERAMAILEQMADVFVTPIDQSTILVAKDDADSRRRLERVSEETIYLPGLTVDQINELAQVVKSVFDVRQSTVQTGLGSLVIRAPQDMLGPLNETLKELIDSPGQVMVEVKLYEVDTTRDLTAGATIPTQFSVFNIDQAANAIVNSNQTLVQQAIAQGYVPTGSSNLAIALALIKLGLVQSSLASNLIGVIGGGLFQTGISATTGTTTFNLGLNSTDTRMLDDVQLRVGDHQPAIFREGNRYPITQSTYSTGISTAASTLSNATINGVPVSSLLQQYTGGSSVTIPQVTYEDLGVTLKATPVVEKSGRINLLLDLKIEALSGSTVGGNPILDSRQFSSDLTVADGESALMVSNVTASEAAALTGIPGLSELPGFQVPLEVNHQGQHSQLVVVVTPHIVRRRSDLIAGPRIPVAGRLDE